jgi:hypothetical protein
MAYIKSNCLTKLEIEKNGGAVVNNPDGTVSVFYNNPILGKYPVQLTTTCCKALDPSYIFDIDTQTCKWSNTPISCGFSKPINLIVNTKGNDGTLFFVDDFEYETCELKISFDYLLKIKCEDLLNLTNPTITTNYLTTETQNQINLVQQQIEQLNSEIEAITNQIILKNDEILATPYSMECLNFPIITDNKGVDCVVSDWVVSDCIDGFITKTRNVITPASNGGVGCPVLTEEVACETPCYTFTSSPYDSTITIVYIDCNGASKTITETCFSTICRKTINARKIISSTETMNNVGLSSTISSPFSNFNNTAFNSTATATTTTTTIQPVNTTTTFTTKNYCLTDSGLEIWRGILGETRYAQFILGDDTYPGGYTCDDVILMATPENLLSGVIYECTTLFGTKSTLISQLNALMNQLSIMQNNLITLENTLIDLVDNFAINTDSNTGCLTPTQALESLDFEMHLDVVNDDKSLTSVFSAATFPAINSTSNLYDYLTTNGDSGFYICGDPSKTDIGLSNCTTLSLNNNNEQTSNVYTCESIINNLINDLFVDYTGKTGLIDKKEFLTTFSSSALTSNWLSYSTVISDPKIIELITNKKIKISFKINYSCVDFCLLLDNIVLDKSCKTLEKNDIIISKNPGFDLKRIVDNKKSWVDTTTPTNREFIITKSNGTNPFRQTDYDINDERLVINSKEIDLDISIASAIETDVWCYLNDNYGLLTGVTTCNPCEDITKDIIKNFQDDECFFFMDSLPYNFMNASITDSSDSLCCGDSSLDFTKLFTADLSNINTISDFENIMVSELIDVKNRQTISAYPTLRAIYERYLASYNYVNTTSSGFDYVTMDKFSNLIGNYWVDIIEQVIPSTAIWGSVKIYTNTIFDEQKFKYKEYTALIYNSTLIDTTFTELNKTNNIKGIFCGSENVEIIESYVSDNIVKKYTIYDMINLGQMNVGSEFIGTVNRIKTK